MCALVSKACRAPMLHFTHLVAEVHASASGFLRSHARFFMGPCQRPKPASSPKPERHPAHHHVLVVEAWLCTDVTAHCAIVTSGSQCRLAQSTSGATRLLQCCSSFYCLYRIGTCMKAAMPKPGAHPSLLWPCMCTQPNRLRLSSGSVPKQTHYCTPPATISKT
ncbi:hypothetical protein GUJ93_ZPchr0013g34948 [Zizania palustris]|uniref:Uncharacterized protein n=1 Tax=Zizania palustris TaxID=103762 RepID=A0A8J5X2K0_ZIZPA|nr:hypothetical protein GUJ93_ZPchr0013g34948 [Zizania palustris]